MIKHMNYKVKYRNIKFEHSIIKSLSFLIKDELNYANQILYIVRKEGIK